MIDLFGLRQKESTDPVEPAPQDTPSESSAPRGSHRLWALLLVLDSIFVIIFGGAVAAKIYRHWEAPPVSVPFVRHRQAKPSALPAASPAASTVTVMATPPEPIKPPEPPKAPEPEKAAKPEAAKAPQKAAVLKTVAGAESPRPPKPSMLTEGPKPRTAPTPSEVASSPAAAPVPAPASGVKQKAVPVLFKISAPNASKVFLVGAFIVHGGRKEMSLEDGGVWSVKLYLNPGQYRYFFSVDKKKTLDPENPQSDRGASLVTVQ